MEKKVLVVGGAGYIGGAVTDFLKEKNISFTVYDSLFYEDRFFKQVDFIYGDVRDHEKLKEILPNYSHVIWLAAIVGDPACKIRPDLTIAINQDAVEWLSKNYDGRIVFMSTCSVYGKNDSVVNEESELNPLSLYAETKAKAEQFLKNKNSLIFRLGTVFGVSDTYSRPRMDLAVNYMTANAVVRGKLSVFGGSQWRPFIHVRKVGEVIANFVDAPITGIFNLASFNYQIKDLAEEIGAITGAEIVYADQKFQDERNYNATNEKALKANMLGSEKSFTIHDGVDEIYKMVKSKRIKYTENDVYFNERHVANLNENGEFK
ncbi:MAG: SDR family oxidoreductase [bacterium]